MQLIKALTTPGGHELVNVQADFDVLLELGFDEAAANAFMLQALADELRDQRDAKLKQFDAIVSNPLRWAEFTAEQQAELAAYRQALLDVPQQDGFPAQIEWPVMPDI